eukprot:211884_1
MAQLETNEGSGEDDELMQWLTNNRLLMIKEKCKSLQVSIDDIRELVDPELINQFVKNDLKLTGMIASRCINAIKAIRKQVVRVVLSTEEDDALNIINNELEKVSLYLNKLNDYISSLNNISSQNEDKINKFKKEIMNQLNVRMNELCNKSNYETNKKKENIQLYINNIKKYSSSLYEAKKK